jgi:chromosome segregation ATPase
VSIFGKASKQRDEIRFLNGLRDDLRILQHSWRNGTLPREKVFKVFREIIDSIDELAPTESLETVDLICDDLREYVTVSPNGNGSAGERAWTLTLELIDLLGASMDEETADAVDFEEFHSRILEEKNMKSSENNELREEASQPRTEPQTESVEQEGTIMAEAVTTTNPQELLQQAHEALMSGNGESAKQLALKAADLISKQEAEAARRRENELRTELDRVVDEESRTEDSLRQIKDDVAEREQQVGSLQARLEQARTAFAERDQACTALKKQIHLTEEELATLKQKYKELFDSFHEALPARDAADRERAKIEAEYETVAPDIEGLRDDMQALERRLEDIRRARIQTEAGLQALANKIGA